MKGPAGELRPVTSSSGSNGHMLALRSDLVDHPMILEGLDEVRGFLESPGPEGIAPLAAWNKQEGELVYPADGVLLADLVEKAGRLGEKACLELLAGVLEALDAVAQASRAAGVPNHSSLTLCSIVVTREGKSKLIGYGVPAVEVLAWLDEESDLAPIDSFRFAPPERIEDSPETSASDIWSLGLVAAEAATGRAVLRSKGQQVVDDILDGKAQTALRRTCRGLPRATAKILASMVDMDQSARPDASTLLRQVHSRLSSSQGTSLAELVRPFVPAVDDEPTAPIPADEGPGSGWPAFDPDPDDDEDAATQTIDPQMLRALGLPEAVTSVLGLDDVAAAVDASDANMEATTVAPVARPPASTRLEQGKVPVPDEEQTQPDDGLMPMPLPPRVGPQVADVPKPVSLPPADPSAPIPELGPSPTLQEVRNVAKGIVVRVAHLSALAEGIPNQLRKRFAEANAEPDARFIAASEASARKAKRAAAATKSAADLLELDEDAKGALITLDLVRNAEAQAEKASHDASSALETLERRLEKQRANLAAIADATARAATEADAAGKAAEAADQRVTELEAESKKGHLTAEGVDDAIDAAIEAAEAAHAAAEDARAAAGDAKSADRLDVAQKCTDRARQLRGRAEEQLANTEEQAQKARQLEADGLAAAVERCRQYSVTASGHADDAEGAARRAEEAVVLIGGKEATALTARAQAEAKRARSAADDVAAALERAKSASFSSDAGAPTRQASQLASTAAEASQAAKEASERVVAKAGAVAQARAEHTKAVEEVKRLAERAQRAAKRGRETFDATFEATNSITGEEALTLRREALELVRDVEEEAEEAQTRADALMRQEGAEAVRAELSEMVAVVERIEKIAEDAVERTNETRQAAERELADLRRREAARKRVEAAAAEAASHAADCQKRVSDAWTLARAVAAEIEAHPHEVARRLKEKAFEIIDIAEFQAGEAAASAKMAVSERDPEEATAHADTAKSFADRIREDLPEATSALEQARELVQKEQNDRATALERTEQLRDQVGALTTTVRELLDQGRATSAAWANDTRVSSVIMQLERCADSIAEDLTEVRWAYDRARQVDSGSAALEVVPDAEEAAKHAVELKRRAEAEHEALSKALHIVEGEAKARETALADVSADLEAVEQLQLDILESGRRLSQAIDANDASGEAIIEARVAIRRAVEQVREAVDQLRALVGRAEAAPDASIAQTIASKAEAVRSRAESSVEDALEAETTGIAAAEQEARERQAAEQRRLVGAKEAASAQAETARQIVSRVQSDIDQAKSALDSTVSEDARSLYRGALRHCGALHDALTRLEEDVEHTHGMTHVADATAAADDCRAAADQIASQAQVVSQTLVEAVDLAREAEAEAKALSGVKGEIDSIVERAEEAVTRAKEEARRILRMLRDTPKDEVRTLAEEAAQHIQAATIAATKAKAAAPIAHQAVSLEIAKNLLKTTRLALDRANAAADQVRDLVDEALAKLEAQQEREAQQLAEARARAEAPASEALAQAKKAQGWLETGKRDMEDSKRSPAVLTGLLELESAVERVQKLARAAQAAAEPAADAPNVDEADAIEARVSSAATTCAAAARTAREALEDLREAIEQERADERAVESARSECADCAAKAARIAEQAESTIVDLAQLLAQHHPPSSESRAAFAAAKEAAGRTSSSSTDASAASLEADAAQDVARIKSAAKKGADALAAAMVALQEVADKEALCHDAIDKMAEAARLAKEQEEAERRAAEEAKKAEAEAARQAEEAARDADAAAREDDRRARFERRRQERSGRASDKEDLRDRLKSRRSSSSPPSSVPADRPRRRRRRSEDQGMERSSEREVRQWSPRRRSAPEPAAAQEEENAAETKEDPSVTSARPRRAPRPKASRPRADKPPETNSADALLERLRSRNRRD